MDLVLIAVALTAGVDRLRLALLACCMFAPWLFGALVVLAGWLSGSSRDERSVRFLESVSAELRSGSSLRQAVAGAAAAVGEEALANHAGDLPSDALGRLAGQSFPEVRDELEVSFGALAESGAPSAELFDELAAVASAAGEIRREVRVASAPGRAAAAVLLGAPVAYLGFRWSTGQLQALFESEGQRAAGMIGAVLFLAGLASALWLLKRAS